MRRPRFKAPPGRSRYGRNRFGGVVWRRDDRAHAQTPTAVTTEDNYYLYDGTNQIKEPKRGNLAGTPPNYTGMDPIQQQENWTYDAAGNWTRYSNPSTAEGHTQDREHNDGNELWKISVSGLGEVWPIYDSMGNMRTLPKAPGVSTDQYTLKWDAWNRLVEVKEGSTVVASYTYDGLNRRLTKTAGSETRHYYYDTQWRPLEERVGSSTTPDRQYTWGVRDRWDLIRRKRSTTNPLDETLYVLRDYLDPVAIVGTDGTVLERYAYDAFGSVRFLDPNYGSRSNSSYAWDFLFHAEFRDPETKLYNYGHRYYDTGLGRWLSRDPIGERGGMNLYGFVGNNSLMTVDRLGLERLSLLDIMIRWIATDFEYDDISEELGDTSASNSPSLINNLNPFGLRSDGGRYYYERFFLQRYPKAIAAANAKFRQSVQKRACDYLEWLGPTIARDHSLRFYFAERNLPVTPGSTEYWYDDAPQIAREQLNLGSFDIKLVDVKVHWTAPKCFTWTSKMVIMEHLGADNPSLRVNPPWFDRYLYPTRMFVARDVMYASWDFSGEACCFKFCASPPQLRRDDE